MKWVRLPESALLPRLAPMRSFLDADELQRYELYRTDVKRIEFLFGRVLVKLHIGQRLGIDPRRVRLGLGRFGKPTLGRDACGGPAFGGGFNLAHADGIACAVFGPMLHVGVDVERTDRDCLNLLAEVFQPCEIELVDSAVHPAHKRERFHRLWTRKEALVKAEGCGFSVAPRAFSVPGADGRVLAPPYFFETLQIAGEYTLSVVARCGPHDHLRVDASEVDWRVLLSATQAPWPRSVAGDLSQIERWPAS